MIGEVIIIVIGSVFWCLMGYGIGFEHGFSDGRCQTWRDAAQRLQDSIDCAEALTGPLKCPVCGAGRSNAEISQGYCANCGVYHDG